VKLAGEPIQKSLLTFEEENIDGIAFFENFLEFLTFQEFFLQIPGFYSPNSENMGKSWNCKNFRTCEFHEFRESKEFQELFSPISRFQRFTLQFYQFSRMLFSEFCEFRKFQEFGELFSPISKK
jgi:hypothetical protein